MKKTKPLLAMIVILLGLAAAVYYFRPGASGTLAEMTLKDGTQLRVVQTRDGEPFQIGFYLKRPGEPWGWCYMDHEATRWSTARLVQDTDTQSVKIYRGSMLQAEYFTVRKTFALYAEYQRELPAPQEHRVPPGF